MGQFVTGKKKRSNTCNSVPIKSVFGWVISRPNECNHQNHSSVNTTMSHVLQISCQENHNHLNKKVNRFWNLAVIGISPNESSVYEKFENNIKFKDNRYSVNLPIKDYDPLLPDNYELSLKRLYKLQERSAKDEIILKQYDEVIQDQLEHGIIEEVKGDGVVGNVAYPTRK